MILTKILKLNFYQLTNLLAHFVELFANYRRILWKFTFEIFIQISVFVLEVFIIIFAVVEYIHKLVQFRRHRFDLLFVFHKL